MTIWEISVLAFYFLVLGILAVYGFHRYQLVYLYYRNRSRAPRLPAQLETLPAVTIQLPVYNERLVVGRLIDAVSRMDYPRDLLEIQVLDDSTDETVEIASDRVFHWRQQGLNIHHIHRTHRKGFKAGALEEGLKRATGEFVAIFDADFVPPTDFLARTLPYFTDPNVGMVQARWGHLNKKHSLLTRLQALFIDGHFVIEQGGRNRSGRFFNFNGTAGIWRRESIEDAGGWHQETLTEDLDLSYRAQLRGWKFIFDANLEVPGELPPEMEAFRSQQHRWMKGSMQTCLKILPSVLRSKFRAGIKYEAFIHLTGALVYVLMVLLCLVMPAAFAIRANHGDWLGATFFDVSIFVAASISVLTFYTSSQKEIDPRWTRCIQYYPFILAFGMAMSVNNAKAALEALAGKKSPFVRTPKQAQIGSGGAADKKIYRPPSRFSLLAWIELAFGVYMIGAGWVAWQAGHYVALFFFSLFALGFLYMGGLTLFPGSGDPAPEPAVEPATSARQEEQESGDTEPTKPRKMPSRSLG